MAKEPFLTTTDDEPGAGPDLPGVTAGDERSTLARLLGERRLLRVPSLPSLPRPSFSRPVSLPGRRTRRDDVDPAPEGALEPDLDTSLEDALVEALADDAAVADGVDGGLLDDAAGDDSFDEVVAGWVRRAMAAYPRPSYPLEREWDVSIQGIVRLVPYVPRFATAPLALLDRFGAVTIGPQRVGLDGKDVDWDRVVQVRTAPAWTCLSAEALEANLAQYVVALPPLPGRAWVLRKVSELLLSLYLAVLPPDTDGDAAAAEVDAPPEPMFDRVVTQVVHERRFGSGEAQASTTSVLLQLALRGATDTIVRTAAERGVEVVHVRAEDTSVGSVVARAATWRRTALDLRDRVNRRVGR
ncbi:hypothetical protein JN535_10185 [Cellulosimicrobium cellulans]|uniref:hypothetical protein n=1 Tax=Cellulosimicrobium cellulans TaxID=1710 RepID=UPI0019647E3C|nr:hypothetical protein [Cellulosimicrobium cellulans]MBN0040530.1 hypothetical protein [Cellulosimicrobium cellulans]